MVNFIIPFNLVIKVKDIDEDEIENYMTDIMLAIDSVFYSSDEDDDHFEVMHCHPQWNRSYKESYYEN